MFTELGFKDVFIGSELYKYLGVTEGDMKHPHTAAKLTAIAKYINGHTDPLWVIKRVTRNKSSMSNLDYLASYVELKNHIGELDTKLNDILDKTNNSPLGKISGEYQSTLAEKTKWEKELKQYE